MPVVETVITLQCKSQMQAYFGSIHTTAAIAQTGVLSSSLTQASMMHGCVWGLGYNQAVKRGNKDKVGTANSMFRRTCTGTGRMGRMKP